MELAVIIDDPRTHQFRNPRMSGEVRRIDWFLCERQVCLDAGLVGVMDQRGLGQLALALG